MPDAKAPVDPKEKSENFNKFHIPKTSKSSILFTYPESQKPKPL